MEKSVIFILICDYLTIKRYCKLYWLLTICGLNLNLQCMLFRSWWPQRCYHDKAL